MTLKKVLGRAAVTYDELQTLLTEIEANLNDRPLTFVSSDVNYLPPLTPSMLLCARKITVSLVYRIQLSVKMS